MRPFKLSAFADEASPLLDGQIQAMQRNGITGLEMRLVDGENISDLSVLQAREIHKRLSDAGITVWALGSPIGKIDIETDCFENEMDRLKHTIELAQILQAENIRMFSFYLPQNSCPEAYRHKVLERLGKMAEAARGTGVTLCHENEKGIYGDTPERCLEILTEIPEIAGVFDPANFIQCGQETWRAWTMLHSYIKYMHIKDARTDGWVVPAGEGAGELPRLLEAYSAQGGQWLTIEPHLLDFAGLRALEREGETSRIGVHVYNSSDEAFDAACTALRKLIG